MRLSDGPRHTALARDAARIEGLAAGYPRGLTTESPVWLEDAKSAAGDPDFSYSVSRFVTFQGILFLAGRGSHANMALVSWFAVFSTGVIVNPIRAEAGQDLTFDARLEIPPDANFEIKLGFELANGIKLVVDQPLAETSEQSFHQVFTKFGDLMKPMRSSDHVLEIGSRDRLGIINLPQAIIRGLLPPDIKYTGLDIKEGKNVDVVGDAHALSQYFAPETFNAVFSLAVFEHLIMPWKVAVEMNRVMKIGAVGYVMSHQTFPLHDVPWDFWRFSNTGWHAIFNRFTGFEIIDTGLGGRAYIAADYLGLFSYKMDEVPAYLLSNVLLRKIGPSLVDWPVDAGELLNTTYPY